MWHKVYELMLQEVNTTNEGPPLLALPLVLINLSPSTRLRARAYTIETLDRFLKYKRLLRNYTIL
jgi:hypothetical protein